MNDQHYITLKQNANIICTADMNDEDLFLKDYTNFSIFHVSKTHLELVSLANVYNLQKNWLLSLGVGGGGDQSISSCFSSHEQG